MFTPKTKYSSEILISIFSTRPEVLEKRQIQSVEVSALLLLISCIPKWINRKIWSQWIGSENITGEERNAKKCWPVSLRDYLISVVILFELNLVGIRNFSHCSNLIACISVYNWQYLYRSRNYKWQKQSREWLTTKYKPVKWRSTID